ncbi:vegetative cell wall protein gp1-like [Sorghum bicolor]|uniref:vegetative cell wall protein gp1-like n=1 Tax=Sorghum bicolor TaxID=4558 RepID=UPI000B424668|nr:vegetative cell wall protein gp1-like [Sorghum bicolor]|eukprot:XP_021309003.1 vegetative cell wall protein gp1-like [Sorghum bicolor]
MASLILQIVWMAMNRARTLGTHFGNNRLQAELLEDIRELLGEARGYRLRGERRDLNRNPGRFPVRRRFGGNRHANVGPPSRRSVVSSTASPVAPSAAPPAAPPSRAPTPPAPPAPVLALPAPPRPRCPLHGDGPCPPPPPSMVASQWLSLGIEPQSPIRYPTPTPSSERAAHSPPPRRPSPPTIAARMSAPTRLPPYFGDPAAQPALARGAARLPRLLHALRQRRGHAWLRGAPTAASPAQPDVAPQGARRPRRAHAATPRARSRGAPPGGGGLEALLARALAAATGRLGVRVWKP